ncbi:MAG: hypothetical protein AAGA15_05390 [Pseudomonadota bacterium]
MRMKSLNLIVLPLLLAGCVPMAPITQSPVQMSFATEERQNAVTGLDTATVRARLLADDTSAEIVRVPCRVSGPGYSATFVTPAAVEFPLFRNTAPQVTLSCSYDGETQTRTLNARNVSERERREARRRLLDDLEDGDRSGVSLLLAYNTSFRRRGFDEFDYPESTFRFRR